MSIGAYLALVPSKHNSGDQTLVGDPALASERTALENQIALLKARKRELEVDTYYAELEPSWSPCQDSMNVSKRSCEVYLMEIFGFLEFRRG